MTGQSKYKAINFFLKDHSVMMEKPVPMASSGIKNMIKRFAYVNARIERIISDTKKRLSFVFFMKRRMIPAKEKMKEKIFKDENETIISIEGFVCSLMVIPIFGN